MNLRAILSSAILSSAILVSAYAHAEFSANDEGPHTLNLYGEGTGPQWTQNLFQQVIQMSYCKIEIPEYTISVLNVLARNNNMNMVSDNAREFMVKVMRQMDADGLKRVCEFMKKDAPRIRKYTAVTAKFLRKHGYM